MTQMERLEECYNAAYNADDINLCLEIADRMKMLAPAAPVDGNLVQAFTESLDQLIHISENTEKDNPLRGTPHRFAYCGHEFEVKLIDG